VSQGRAGDSTRAHRSGLVARRTDRNDWPKRRKGALLCSSCTHVRRGWHSAPTTRRARPRVRAPGVGTPAPLGPSGVTPGSGPPSGGTSSMRRVTPDTARAIVATASEQAAPPLNTISSATRPSRRSTPMLNGVASDTKSRTRAKRRNTRLMPGGSDHPGSREMSSWSAPTRRRSRSSSHAPSGPHKRRTRDAAEGRGDAVTTVWPASSSRRTAATEAAAPGVGTGGKLPTTKTASGWRDLTGTGHYWSNRDPKACPNGRPILAVS
jgi:hypothetical protein